VGAQARDPPAATTMCWILDRRSELQLGPAASSRAGAFVPEPRQAARPRPGGTRACASACRPIVSSSSRWRPYPSLSTINSVDAGGRSFYFRLDD